MEGIVDQAKFQLLIDRAEISDTVIRYATGIDMRDWQAYRSCFADEVDLDFTSWSGGSPMRLTADEWTEAVRSGLSGFRATQHISSNHVIAINEDEATCVSYMQAQHYLPTDSGSNCFTLGGFYTNTLVRTPQGWKIHKCKLTVTWSDGNRGLFEEAARRLSESEER
jgi:hypothetical protein